MKKPNINTSKPATPMLYGYTTPEIARHNGWTKIGYTEQNVEDRIKQQTHTADVLWNLEWKGNAIFDDGSGETFTDKDFHAYLRKRKFEQEEGKNNEWFKITGPQSRSEFCDFRENHGILKTINAVLPYVLRDEQEEAVSKTVTYKRENPKGEFLWNAKPRFGKTLSVYDFVKRINAKRVLIVTNRPAIANSWLSDYNRFIGTDRGYYFVSDVDTLKGKLGVLTYSEYMTMVMNSEEPQNIRCIRFVSLQDLKGSIHFGGKFNKHTDIPKTEWDVLVIDEAHEGVDTYKTDIAFNHIKRNFTLHLSGTPFKALANDKFSSEAIFNWTYTDEQQKKRDWKDEDGDNPYENLPKLNLYTYQMSEIVRDELKQGTEINGETEEFAFDLNEFFMTNGNGQFIYNSSVDKFLDALTCQEKFPFSTPELREEIKHSFWLLNRVDSAKALAKKLNEHPVFKDYEIVLAAGDGRLSEDEENEKSYDKVINAIEENDKTITLSVGQLTTGVTIPEWTAVLMLSNIKSPALYMQAAFRAQNPCLFKFGPDFKRKENAYVFDFDPARTLVIFEEFANDLSPNTASGKGDIGARKHNIRMLLNFFPVIGEDEDGELTELDAEKVLSIPRKIRSVEVVRRGFMSNFLFQNIANIFGAPKEVLDIIEGFTPIEEPKAKPLGEVPSKEDLSLNENGEVELSEDIIIGQSTDVFGEKIYGTLDELIEDTIAEIDTAEKKEKEIISDLKKFVKEEIQERVVETAKDYYGDEMKKAETKRILSDIERESDRMIETLVGDYSIEKKVAEQERQDALMSRFKTGKTTDEIEDEFERKLKESEESFNEKVSTAIKELVKTSTKEAVKTVETGKKNREKQNIEDGVRDHLRGFTRTIPSFLMAYGDEDTTLDSFDKIIPADVFKEVTGITIEQFCFLRDGGDYIDDSTGETKHFGGHLFDSVVFDDSVKEFLSLKCRLANYFDESNKEDIFDYIPPQKTNQIFTPKKVVKNMVDLLEQENPGCYDNSEKTFIDMYMKSGLYIAEIVKRLFNSDVIKKQYPDDIQRLKHIFEKQVYGLAPTEIIYKIATSFILGFDEEIAIATHNFRQLDALPCVKEGTLEQKLSEIYGENNSATNDSISAKPFDKSSIRAGMRITDKTFGTGTIIEKSDATVTIKFDDMEEPRKMSFWNLAHGSMIIEG